MSEFDQMYREVILDHYKNPRGHGVIDGADAQAEGTNPLCGDEVSIYVSFEEDGETIEDVKFSGRGCAISQASTSMLMEMVKGRKASEIASLPKDDLLEEIGIPLTPIRLKCALLGLGVLKVALHRAKGTPLPQEWAGLDELEDRCSHDDGPLCEGEFDLETGVVICPRHGANFDIRSGRALTLPAYQPVETFPVRVEDGMIRVSIV